MPGRLWLFIAVAGAAIMLLMLALPSGDSVQPALDPPAAAARSGRRGSSESHGTHAARSAAIGRRCSGRGEAIGVRRFHSVDRNDRTTTRSRAGRAGGLWSGTLDRRSAYADGRISAAPADGTSVARWTKGRRLARAIPLADPQAGRASGLLAAERTMADFRLFDAVERLRAIKRQYPDDYAADQLLARVYEALGLKWEAQPHLFGLLQNGTITEAQLISLIDRILPSPQMEVSAKAATLFPKDLRPRLMQAQALASQQQWRAALKMTAPITKAHPDYLPAYILEGSLLLELDQLDGLTAWGRRNWMASSSTLTIGMLSANGRFAVVILRRQRGAFGEACRLDPDYREAYTHLAEALDSLGDNAGAAKCWERAERLSKLRQQLNLWGVNRQSAQRTVAVADALCNLGRYWEAQAWLMFARRAPLEPVADLPTRLAANQRSLAASRDRVDPMAQPALAIPVDQYPLPAWDAPKASAELATDGVRKGAAVGRYRGADRLGLPLSDRAPCHGTRPLDLAKQWRWDRRH